MSGPLSRPFRVGSFRCHALEAGTLGLDGGAMFGVVPKPLWERRIPPDSRNRIPLATRCLLVEHPDGPLLVDTGLGNRDDPKFREIYAVDNAADPWPTRLEAALDASGVSPAEVRWVVNTHLHFDHAGGNAVGLPSGETVLSCPNATYVVQRGELEFARHPNERTAGSYLAHAFEPVAARERWLLIEGDGEILPGITLMLTPGHVPFHQSVLVADGGEAALFLADLVPTTAHLPLPWIMGYDLEPLRTLESKRSILRRAAASDWLLLFEHDPRIAFGRVRAEGKGYALVEEAVAT